MRERRTILPRQRSQYKVYPMRCPGYIDIHGNNKYAIGHTPTVLASYVVKQKTPTKYMRCKQCKKAHASSRRRKSRLNKHFKTDLEYIDMIIGVADEALNEELVRSTLVPWQVEYLQSVIKELEDVKRSSKIHGKSTDDSARTRSKTNI